MKNRILTLCSIGVLIVGVFSFSTAPLHATVSLDELQNKISEACPNQDQIEKDIAKYEKELQTVGGERKTLESAITELNLTRKTSEISP